MNLTVIISQRQVIISIPRLDAELIWPPPLLLFPVRLQGIDDLDFGIDCILIDLHVHRFGRFERQDSRLEP